MANNYSECSFTLPREWPEGAKRDFYNILVKMGCNHAEVSSLLDPDYVIPDWVDVKTIFADYMRSGGIADYAGNESEQTEWVSGTVWVDRYGDVGYYDEDSYDTCVDDLLQVIANHYHIKRKYAVHVDVAYTCSKPRPGEFGGSSAEIFDLSTQPCLSCTGFVQVTLKESASELLQLIVATILSETSKNDEVFPELIVNITGRNTVYISDTAFFWKDKILQTITDVLEEHKAEASMYAVWIYPHTPLESGAVNIETSNEDGEWAVETK